MEQEQEREQELLPFLQLVNAVALYNLISLPPCKLILVDLRDRVSYEQNHIFQAWNFPVLNDEIELEKLFPRYVVTCRIVIIDLKGNDFKTANAFANLTRRSNTPPALSLGFLEGGFESFCSAFPFLCRSGTDEGEHKPDSISRRFGPSWPSMVLEDLLYLGDYDCASDLDVLNTIKIRRIVNCTPSPNCFEGQDGFEYLQIPVNDFVSADIHVHFEAAVEFIERGLEQSQRTLVHCHAGVSRSASIVSAFLMKHKGWTLKDTLDYVVQKRACVSPNVGFIVQLSRYEESLFGRQSLQSYEGLNLGDVSLISHLL